MGKITTRLKRQDKRLKQPLKMQNGKALPVAVDQSVKIEELCRDSVIGIASRKASIAYVVPRRVKRHFNEYFRRIGQPCQCAPSVFAAAIVTSLQAGKWSSSIIVVDKVIKQQKTAGEPHRPGLTGVRKPNQPVSHQYSKR